MNKLNGTLIVNKFLKSAQTDKTYEWLLESAVRNKIDITLRSNADYLVHLDNRTISSRFDDNPDFVLFWNKDVCLARALEYSGYRLFNPSDAIANCDNKALTTEALISSGAGNKLRLPRTIKIPMTFGGIGYTDYEFVDFLGDILGFPFVIKESCGSYGGQVYLATNRQTAVDILSRMNGTDCIAQEYIDVSRGRDLRAYVVGDRVVAAIERRNDNDFRANISNGGSSFKYDITPEQEQMAIDAAKALKLDFAGVDLMFLKDDAPILCEVNSNAQFLGLYEATGINIPDCIFEYITKEL